MSSLTIRNLDSAIKERLRVRAAEHGHSMEAEARQILGKALAAMEPRSGHELYKNVRKLFEPLGGVELELPKREATREPPHFE